MSCSVSQTYIEIGFSKKKKRSSFSFMYALCWGSLDFIGHLKSSKPLSRKTGQIFADRLELIWLLFFTCYRSSQICLGEELKGRKGEGVVQDNSRDQLNEKQIFRNIFPSNAACCSRDSKTNSEVSSVRISR